MGKSRGGEECRTRGKKQLREMIGKEEPGRTEGGIREDGLLGGARGQTVAGNGATGEGHCPTGTCGKQNPYHRTPIDITFPQEICYVTTSVGPNPLTTSHTFSLYLHSNSVVVG